jgi:hypothetical protein
MAIEGGAQGGAVGAISRPMQLATPVIIARPRPPSSVGGLNNTVAKYEPDWYKKLVKSQSGPATQAPNGTIIRQWTGQPTSGGLTPWSMPGASQPLQSPSGLPNRLIGQGQM